MNYPDNDWLYTSVTYCPYDSIPSTMVPNMSEIVIINQTMPKFSVRLAQIQKFSKLYYWTVVMLVKYVGEKKYVGEEFYVCW